MPGVKRLPTSERRKQIVNAGLELCRKEGIASLRTEKIARRIGVTPGALFRHFPSKSAILQAMAESLLERLEATVPDPVVSGWDWIEQHVKERVRLLNEDPDVRMLFSEGFIFALPPEAREKVHLAFARSWEMLAENIQVAQKEGRARGDLEAHELGAAIVGLVQAVLHPPLGDLTDWSNPESVWRTAADLIGSKASRGAGG
ncbi:TetR/AcrR family transcriptional regulator [Oceanithermus sp.]